MQADAPATTPVVVAASAPTVRVFPAGSTQESTVQAALSDILHRDAPPTTLQEVDQWSAKLTAALRRGGFPLGQVLMTQQDWQVLERTGQPVFTAFPGRIGQIVIHNKSRVADERLYRLVTHALCGKSSLDEVCLFQSSRFERTTQLLQDLPGVALDGAPKFAPGDAQGTVKVDFAVTQKGKPLSASVTLDNNGIDATGRMRAGVSVAGNNYFGLGEDYAFSITGTDKRMWTGALSAGIPVFSDGMRLTGGFSRQQYSVLAGGTAIAGFANTVSAGLLYPFTRGLDSNVWGGLSVLHTNTSLNYRDFGVGTTSSLDSMQLSLTANNGDRAQQLRTNVWSAQGALTLGHQRNDDPNDVGPHRAGNYLKLAGTGVGTYALDRSGDLFLRGRVTAQLSDRNLDPSEQLLVGGPNAVRAYRLDEPSADEGVIASVGLYRRFSVATGHQIQPGIFVDYGLARVNHSPWQDWAAAYPGVPGVTNIRHLAGYGASVDWLTPYGAIVSVSASKAFGFSDDSWVDPGRKPIQYWLSVTWNH
ncbi:ShlB/FhaC/HecB family hemolysin secretion/activation protein [Paraburkholderia antibiotica]|uniref:ShlB/FhaC/HecB family hemolysin secretion/activation protein n=1 Tax=Paraburkholderia antibiotica TaxID=2728839 RepID=A0A7Y0FG39_9BURK|nr:ShlB/FhaC/HecB family hemolysin secretion/activation protein [Paraburkholderia antibiotica]NML34654.1 ShlB/FhaC/HecB family hemolysin secretion/activation protein [Paraburkholderia antibiotica]